LLQANFKGRDLEIFLTRLLFCLFADDTGIFGENNMFRRLMEATRADGGDVGRVLAELFQVLDTSDADRQKNLDEALARFAYINGKLFADPARIPSFDSGLRAQLIACAQLDWSNISPAIFGAMFQGVLEKDETANPSPALPLSGKGAHDSSPDKGRLGGVVERIELAAQAILDARALYPESSLADLYDPTAMPPELTKAHTALDKAVDAAY
jgi:hypothetical protein